MRPRQRLLPALAGLLLAAAPLQAQDTEWNRYTLEDLGGVFIRMEVTEACEAVGVAASEYEADVSLALIDADVDVLTQDEMLELPALPELRVTVDCATGSNGMSGAIAYSVELRVQQSAQMLRDTQITLPEAVTWFSSDVGVTDPDTAVETIGATLTEQVEAFAAAWTEINAEGEGGG